MILLLPLVTIMLIMIMIIVGINNIISIMRNIMI